MLNLIEKLIKFLTARLIVEQEKAEAFCEDIEEEIAALKEHKAEVNAKAQKALTLRKRLESVFDE